MALEFCRRCWLKDTHSNDLDEENTMILSLYSHLVVLRLLSRASKTESIVYVHLGFGVRR